MSATIWAIATVFVLFLIELVKGRHRRMHRLQDGFIIAATIVHSTLMRPLMTLATALVFGLLMPQWKNVLAGVPFWASFLILLVTAEFGQYWVHRWAHDSIRHPLLFGMHRTHHTAPYVNVTLLYRSNLFWGWVHPYMWTAAIAVYLGQPAAAALFFVSVMLFNGITHSDWRWDDTIVARVPYGIKIVQGWEWLFVSPRLHHAHHGYGRDGKAYRNFNTVLTVFDRMFGTLHVPQGRPWRYGVPGGEHNWLSQIFFPLLPLKEPKRRDRMNRVID